MKNSVCLLLSGCFLAAVQAQTVVLQALRWRAVQDSLQVDFEFAHGHPYRYRIHAPPDTAREKNLLVEFSGALAHDPSHLKSPRWAHLIPGTDSGVVTIKIDLDGSTPWKASWEGDTLRLDILNRVKDGALWKNPWMIGGLGGALLTGGVVFWLSGMERPAPSGNGIIPPPDAVLPQ